MKRTRSGALMRSERRTTLPKALNLYAHDEGVERLRRNRVAADTERRLGSPGDIFVGRDALGR